MAANRLAQAIQQTMAKIEASKRKPHNVKVGLPEAAEIIRTGAKDSPGMPNKLQMMSPDPMQNQMQAPASKPASQMDGEEKEKEEGGQIDVPISLGISRNDQFEAPSETAKEGLAGFADKVKGFVSGLGQGASGMSRTDQFDPSNMNEIKSGMDSFMSSYAQAAPVSRNESWSEPDDTAKEAVRDTVDAIGSAMETHGDIATAPARVDQYQAPDADTANRIKSGFKEKVQEPVSEFMQGYVSQNPKFDRNASDVKMSDGEAPTPDYSWMENFANTSEITREPGASQQLHYGGVAQDNWSREIGDALTSDDVANAIFGTGGLLDPGRRFTIDREGIHRESKEDRIAREQEEIEQSNGKKGGNVWDDPDREKYLSTYEETFKSEPEYDRGSKDPWELLRDDRLDNGSGNLESQVADRMSGAQYKKYREAGIPGRPIDEIDESASYSKLGEYDNYGFIPYVPDKDALRGMSLSRVVSGPTRFFNEMRNAREEMVPYEATINGKTVNSSQFDPLEMNAYLRRMQRGLEERGEKTADWFNAKGDHTGMTAYTPKAYQVTFPDGTVEMFPGGGYEILKNPTYDFDESGNEYVVDPTVLVRFKDGSVLQFDDEADYLSSMYVPSYRPAEEDEPVERWMPDFVTDDGVALTYPEVLALASDESAEDESDGIAYDMNIGGLGTPATLLPGLLEGGNVGANFWDIAASSAPYFSNPTAWLAAGSNAATALAGESPMEQDRYGVGRQIAESIRPDQYWMNVGVNAAMPFTERLAGGIVKGDGLFKRPLLNPDPFIKKRLGGTAAEPLALAASDIAGEGLEEAIGNVFEEASRNGLLGWYADDMLDENGKPVYDSTGHVVKDLSTSGWRRVGNYAADAPEAMAGGGLLGGAFRAPSIVRRDIPETARRMVLNKNLKQAGLKPYREVEPDESAEFVLPESLAARYESEGDR